MPTPLDEILTAYGLSNHDLVACSPAQLSHKNVQKARTGSRPVSDAVARSIADALRAALERGVPDPEAEGALHVPARIPSVRELFPDYPRGPATPGAATTEA